MNQRKDNILEVWAMFHLGYLKILLGITLILFIMDPIDHRLLPSVYYSFTVLFHIDLDAT